MKYTMLILEHKRKVRRDLVRITESTGLFDQLLFASNDTEALRHLERSHVDMISSDWQPNTMNERIALLEKLDRTDHWTDIPVVVFTQEENLEMRVAALEGGICECHAYAASSRELAARLRLQLKLAEKTRALRSEKTRMARMALTDMLTGTYNRAHFDATLEAELSRSRRSKRPVSLLMIDMDHFKSINDSHGHSAGDQVLKAAARVLRETTRRSDVVCRYGGEEFSVILPDTSNKNALITAEKIRKAMASLQVTCGDQTIGVTVSIGISACGSAVGAQSPAELVDQADRALYRSKHNGRNRCELHQPTSYLHPPKPFGSFPKAAVGFA